jgi:hypothetical protein
VKYGITTGGLKMLRKIADLSLVLLGIIILAVQINAWAKDDYFLPNPKNIMVANGNSNGSCLSLHRQVPINCYIATISFSYLNLNNKFRDPNFTKNFNEGAELYYEKEYLEAIKKFYICEEILNRDISLFSGELERFNFSNVTDEERMYFYLLKGLCHKKSRQEKAASSSFYAAKVFGAIMIEAKDDWIGDLLEKIESKFTPEDLSVIENFLQR